MQNLPNTLPKYWILYFLILTSFTVIFNFIYKFLKKEFSKSARYKQYYYTNFLVRTIIVFFCILFINVIFIEQNLSNVIYTVTFAIIVFVLLHNIIFSKPLDLQTLKKRFANGVVSLKNDKLEFKEPAKNVANGILELQNYVNVIALNGGYGEGKSSYTKMIIENVNVEKLLYSYISLTGINETKDFSKLFAKR